MLYKCKQHTCQIGNSSVRLSGKMRMLKMIGLMLLLMVSATSADKFLATFPNEITPGRSFAVNVWLLEDVGAGQTVKVAVRESADIRSKLAWDDAEQDLIMYKQTYQFQFWANLTVFSEGAYFYVHIEVQGTKPTYKQVNIGTPRSSTMIQTDKPIYKPSEMVYYRILFVDMFLRPTQDTVMVKILTPDKTVIHNKAVTSDDSGIFGGELELPPDLPLGMYTIKIDSPKRFGSAKFKVDKYVLPKFDVKLLMDRNYAVTQDSTGMQERMVQVSGYVVSLYTYGKNVKGSLVIASGDNVYVSSEIDGRHKFDFSVPTKNEWSYSVSITANVTEKDTNIVQTATASLRIFKNSFKISFVEPCPAVRQYGQLLYSCFVQLTDPMDNLMDPSDLKAYNMTAVVRYTRMDEGVKEQKSISLTSIANSNPFLMEASFSPALNASIDNIELFVNRHGVKGQGTNFYPRTYKSNSGSSLHMALYDTSTSKVLPATESYKSDSNICFEVMYAGLNLEEFYYEILDAYDMRKMEKISTAGQDSNIFHFCIQVDRLHAPAFLILVFAHDALKGEILSTSLIVDVAWTSENFVTVSSSPSNPRPNKPVTINIKTQPKSWVGIVGVDESTLVLGEANSITAAKMIEIVKQYRIFDKAPPKHDYPWPMPLPLGRPVFEEGKRRKKRDAIFPPYHNGDVGAMNIIKNAGLLALTDSDVLEVNIWDNRIMFAMPADYYEYYGYDYDYFMFGKLYKLADGGIPEAAAALPPTDQSEDLQVEDNNDGGDEVRDYFPETWLWDLIEVENSDGSLQLNEFCPSTITDWQVSTWSLHPSLSLAVAPDIQVRCFQPFFLSLNLPYSIKLNEKFKLQIRVFNYQDSGELIVAVTLDDRPEDYELGGTSKTANILEVPAGDSRMVELDFIAKRFGKIEIPVSAEVGDIGITDSVVRELLVEPPGREMKEEKKVITDLSKVNGLTNYAINMADIIKDKNYLVHGSIRGYIQVTGDRLGPIINNLEGAIRMSSGCGEQNMKSVTPSVFVSKYLKSINRMTPEIEQKARRYTTNGFLREKTYMHPDGSYSAFGPTDNLCGCRNKRDMSGSGWLTCFVLKTFSEVLKNDLGEVPIESLNKSLGFLLEQRLDRSQIIDNFFDDPGRVLHTQMQGGSATGPAYTAYALIAMITFYDLSVEKNYFSESYRQEIRVVIGAGCNWLKDKTVNEGDEKTTVKNSVYSRLISAYALARCGPLWHQSAAAILTDLSGPLNMTEMMCPNNHRWASARDDETTTCQNSCNSCGVGQGCCQDGCNMICKSLVSKERSGPSLVEMYAYRLLAYLYVDSVRYRNEADADMNVLMQMMKSNGEFYSTQDTAAGMGALAEYALIYPESFETDFSVTVRKDGNILHRFDIDTISKIALNQYLDEGATEMSTYDFRVEGSGNAMVTVVAYYNIDTDKKDDKEILDLSHEIIYDEETSMGTIKYCIAADGTDEVSVGSMLLGEVWLQSGFEKEDYDILKENDMVSRFEYDEDTGKVVLYFMTNEDNRFSRTCVNIRFYEKFRVTDRKPAQLRATDYYNPESLYTVKYYSLEETVQPTKCPGGSQTCGVSSVSASGVLMLLSILLLAVIQF